MSASKSIGASIAAGLDKIHDSWGWFIALGIALIILGGVCIVGNVTATLVTELAFGWLLIGGAVVALIHAFQVRNWSGFFLFFLSALLRVFTGYMLVRYPLSGEYGLTLLFASLFVVGGVFRATQGLQAKYGKTRCFDAPISELGIVGSAIGMAAYGLRPCVEIQFADYMYPAYDQIVSEAARLRYRSTGDFTCPIVVRMPTGGGISGGQTHSQSPEALFTHVSGLKTVVPSNPRDAKGLLIAAIEDPAIAQKSLRHLGLPTRAPPRGSPWLPPRQLDLPVPDDALSLVDPPSLLS